MITLIHGEDEFERTAALRKVQSRCGSADLVELNTVVLEGRGATLGDVRAHCDTMPFLAERRLVIVQNLLSQLGGRSSRQSDDGDEADAPAGAREAASAWQAFLSEVPDTTELVFAETQRVAGNHPLLRTLKSLADAGEAEIVLCEAPKQEELVGWILGRAATKVKEWWGEEAPKSPIERSAAAELAMYVGRNLRALDTELDKLLTYADGRPVTQSDVHLLVAAVQEANVFQMLDAVSTGQKHLALARLHELRQSNAHPLYLLTMLARQYRILLQVKELSEGGSNTAEIAKRLGLHPYPTGKAQEQSRRYSFAQLERAYARLLETDLAIKTGKMDGDLALDLLVVELSGGVWRLQLQRLSLTNFRNFVRLELNFSTPLTLLQGDNAQGKTNLLEAIHFLSTSRASHARRERDLVHWAALNDPLPYARVQGDVERAEHTVRLEIVLVQQNPGANDVAIYRKQIRINGVNRRALDLLGQLRTVLFLPEDMELVSGPPAVRRRYLDVTISQMDTAYYRHLVAYNRVVSQRNAWLKSLQGRGNHGTDALESWDVKLVEHGSQIMAWRREIIDWLELTARERHAELTGGRERLRLRYLPSFDPGLSLDDEFQLSLDLEFVAERPAAYSVYTARDIAQTFRVQLHRARRQEIQAGMTLYGPHRDDLRFLTEGRDLQIYGSRGQQRTAALALKLAEVAVMRDKTGEAPLLLLDDVMSELDAARRATLLTALEEVPQTIITTTDWDDFSPTFLSRARRLRVVDGRVLDA